MSLAKLIRGKRKIGHVATANSAIPATHPVNEAEPVARIATVAIAHLPEPHPPGLNSSKEAAIRAWLSYIEEADQDVIAEVLDKCRTDLNARLYFLCRAEAVPRSVGREQPVTCGECAHFERIEHHHLGHCARGEPEAIAGLWDTDKRNCPRWQPLALESEEQPHDK